MQIVTLDPEIELMRELDEEYRQRSGLRDRRFYSIFYSRIPPAPLMILGINPGGNPETWNLPPGTDEFCTTWQHEYVDQRYRIQTVMQPLLKRVLGIDDQILRRIPKTNMVFRRSEGASKFVAQQGGMTLWQGLEESAPTLARIVRRVSPRAIIFEGHDALAMFNHAFGVAPLSPSLVKPFTTANGRYPALVYAVHEVATSLLPHTILSFSLAHPSKFGQRLEYRTAEQDMKIRLTPIASAVREVGPPPQTSL